MRVEGFQADREVARTKRTYARQVRRGRIANDAPGRPPPYALGLGWASSLVIVTFTPGSAIACPR